MSEKAKSIFSLNVDDLSTESSLGLKRNIVWEKHGRMLCIKKSNGLSFTLSQKFEEEWKRFRGNLKKKVAKGMDELNNFVIVLLVHVR